MAHSVSHNCCIRCTGFHVIVFITSNVVISLCLTSIFFARYQRLGSGSAVKPNAMYGHVHIPKTAGTTVNGELAARYERVCGNKGYSFSAYQENRRRNEIPVAVSDQILGRLRKSQNGLTKTFTLGLYEEVMMEIGFEDCDYISNEVLWSFWPDNFADWDVPLELHIPCRDPIDHLMSMCNFKDLIFNCSADPILEVEKCIIGLNRFSKQLVAGYKNIYTKCFNAERNAEYIKYMDRHLQRRRRAANYIFRKTNKNRSPKTECIWDNHITLQQVRQYLLQYDYYRFCDSCLNSRNDLLSL